MVGLHYYTVIKRSQIQQEMKVLPVDVKLNPSAISGCAQERHNQGQCVFQKPLLFFFFFFWAKTACTFDIKSQKSATHSQMQEVTSVTPKE